MLLFVLIHHISNIYVIKQLNFIVEKNLNKSKLYIYIYHLIVNLAKELAIFN